MLHDAIEDKTIEGEARQGLEEGALLDEKVGEIDEVEQEDSLEGIDENADDCAAEVAEEKDPLDEEIITCSLAFVGVIGKVQSARSCDTSNLVAAINLILAAFLVDSTFWSIE